MGKASEKGLIINIKVIPKSSKKSIHLENDIFKVKLTAPPVDGKANNELIVFLADLLDIPKSAICIKKGKNSRQKMISIEGITMEDFLDKIEEA